MKGLFSHGLPGEKQTLPRMPTSCLLLKFPQATSEPLPASAFNSPAKRDRLGQMAAID